MRTGQILVGVGILLLIGGISNAMRTYDFHSQHDVSKFAGGIGLAVLVIAIGIYKMRKGPPV